MNNSDYLQENETGKLKGILLLLHLICHFRKSSYNAFLNGICMKMSG